MNRDYYVYVLFRENGQPFYVGMGKGDRWLSHERWCSDNSHKSNIVKCFKRSGISVPKIKLLENLTQQEAWNLERDIILLVGREPWGPLVNLTAGGEGGRNPSPSVRKILSESAKKRGLETAKMNVERIWTEEMRTKASASTKAAMTPERRAAIAEVSKANATPERRKRHGERMREFMSHPENRARISEANTGRVWSEKTRAIVSKQTAERNKGNTYALGRTCTSEHRARVSAAKTGQKYAWIPDPYLFWYSSHVESSPALSEAIGLR